MRGIPRNIAILLALCLLAVTGVVGRAEARGGGGKLSAAAAKLSRGAQIKLDRMKQKMSLRTRGTLQQKTRRQIRLGKKQMMRAMSRRETGLGGSESERTRDRFARDIGGTSAGDNHQEEEMQRSVSQQKKMRDRSVRRAEKAFQRLRRNRD